MDDLKGFAVMIVVLGLVWLGAISILAFAAYKIITAFAS